MVCVMALLVLAAGRWATTCSGHSGAEKGAVTDSEQHGSAVIHACGGPEVAETAPANPLVADERWMGQCRGLVRSISSTCYAARGK